MTTDPKHPAEAGTPNGVKPGGQPGNQNASKGGRTARIVIQCTPREKAWFTKESMRNGGITAHGRRKLGLDE